MIYNESTFIHTQVEMYHKIYCFMSLQEEWARKLRGKDAEIEGFRRDLDAIIEALQLLHDQSN